MIVSLKIPQLMTMIRGLGLSLLLLLGWDFAIVLGYKVMHWGWVGSRNVPLTFYGLAIGIVVSFWNSSAYARWWEARTLWGAIVNKSRTLARQVVTTMSPEATAREQAEVAAVQRQLVLYQVAYVHALRQQLRGLDPLAAVAHLLPDQDSAELAREKNLALALQRRMSAMLIAARKRGWLDQWEWQVIDDSMADLMDAQGGAERIKNTPTPKQFDHFLRFFVHFYCLMLPVGLVETLGWFTPLGSTLVGFMFLALKKIGNDLEEPFANTVFDVPMTAIATAIEINLRQLLGETELPPPEQPVGGVLW
jgi:ion channel-forming bestrophin family protein